MGKTYQGVRRRGKRHKDGTFSYTLDYYVRRPGQPLDKQDRVRETVHARGKREAAEIRARRMKGEEPTGKAQRREDATIPGFATRYLELISPTLSSEMSRTGRRHIVENLVHYFSDSTVNGHRIPAPMEQIRLTDVQAFVNFRQTHQRKRSYNGSPVEWVEKPTTARTVALDVRILKHMYAVAHADGIVSLDAKERVASFGRRLSGTRMPSIPKPGDPGDRARFLDLDEMERVLDVAVSMAEQSWKRSWHVFPIVYTALRTGIRKNGILGMEMARVDVAARRFLDVVDKGKTSRRDVPIPDDLLPVIERAKRMQRGKDCLFDIGRGGAPTDIDTAWYSLLRRAGVESFTFHNLRDTFASWYVIGGGDVYRLKHILGHRSVVMTEKYAKLRDVDLDGIVDTSRSPEVIGTKAGHKWLVLADSHAGDSRDSG